jgi:hypothetical protein
MKGFNIFLFIINIIGCLLISSLLRAQTSECYELIIISRHQKIVPNNDTITKVNREATVSSNSIIIQNLNRLIFRFTKKL